MIKKTILVNKKRFRQMTKAGSLLVPIRLGKFTGRLRLKFIRMTAEASDGSNHYEVIWHRHFKKVKRLSFKRLA